MRTIPILQALLGLLVALPATAGQSGTTTSPEKAPEGLEKSDWQSIRAAHEGWKHRFHAVEGGWQANNPGQQWTTRFDGRGFVATPKAANWTWGLQFQSYGFGGNLIDVSGTPEVRSGEQRLTYQWDNNVEEWFVNDHRGLEHGFMIKERPVGGKYGEPLVFTMATIGGLRPTVSADAQTVHFRDAAGAPVLNYSGLKVWDAEGLVLTSSFEPSVSGAFRITVKETDAKYPLTIDPVAQQAYLKAGNNGPSGGDNFGLSVAVDGNTVVVGASLEDSGTTGVDSTPNVNARRSGAAYVFFRSGSTWAQQAYLKASNTGEVDEFGTSVAVSGDTVIVGAPFEDSNATGVDGSQSDNSSGNAGAAYVFVRSGTTWSQQAYLKASNTGALDNFGFSVAVSGDTAVVGAFQEDASTPGVNGTPNEDAFQSGASYVFMRSGTTWSQQAYLKASNPGDLDNFGSSVAVSGDTVVVGARYEDSITTGVNSTPNDGASNSGAAYVFVRDGTTWSQQAYLKASNTGPSDFFGYSVAVSGDTVVVGAYSEDSSTTGVNSAPNESAIGSGSAYVFVRSGVLWTQQAYLKAANTGSGDFFGYSVAVSGDTVVVGANREDSGSTGVNSTPNESASVSGAAYVFVRSGASWSQQAYLKASNTGSEDQFGYSVAVGGDTVVVGAAFEDSSTTGVNSTPDDGSVTAGAAYVFVRTGGTWGQQAYLKASNTPAGVGSNDEFGTSVAVSGDTVVVGAPFEDSGTTGVTSVGNESAADSGAAYVFVRSGTTWSQQAYLKASNTGAGDNFGISVAVSGDTVVVGARFEDSSTTGVNSTPDESAEDSGSAYVFVRNGTTWSQQAYLKASNNGAANRFGYSVAVSEDTVVVGAYFEDSSTTGVNSTPNDGASNSGAAYVFVRSGTTWSQQAYLKAGNTGAGDFFGFSVAVSGDTAVVGAYQEDSSTMGVDSTPNESASDSGAAYVFVRSGGTWSQQAYLKASNTGANDSFGRSIEVSGETVVIGAIGEDSSTTGVNSTPNDSASGSGAAYVFVRSGTTWSQQAYLKASNTGVGDVFGYSMALFGDTLVVGARFEDSSTTGVNSTPNDSGGELFNSGAAYVFVHSGMTWSQQAYLKASNTDAGEFFGTSVAVSGDTVVVGAPLEDSGTAGVNGSPNESASYSGAAFIFTGLGPVVAPEIAIEQAGSDVPTGSTHPFGSVATGGSLERTFTILNIGTAYLTLSGSPKVALSGSPDFTATAQPASPISAPGGSSIFTVRFTPTGGGPKSATLSIANNDGDENPFVIELTGTATTASALFTSTITSGTGLTDDDALPNAIPFNDGVPNLLKYAFNMNLAGPDTATLPPGTSTGGLPSITTPDDAPPGTLQFEFLRRKGSGLNYIPQKSTTLDNPNWSSLTAAPVVTSIDDQWERVVYTEAPDPIPAPTCFGRVSVSLP